MATQDDQVIFVTGFKREQRVELIERLGNAGAYLVIALSGRVMSVEPVTDRARDIVRGLLSPSEKKAGFGLHADRKEEEDPAA
ncbi:MAG: hypothetical protein QF775_02885 [archaeon]|jgi:hypothetical protein|nr:hypothetical protein [archaeon]